MSVCGPRFGLSTAPRADDRPVRLSGGGETRGRKE